MNTSFAAVTPTDTVLTDPQPSVCVARLKHPQMFSSPPIGSVLFVIVRPHLYHFRFLVFIFHFDSSHLLHHFTQKPPLSLCPSAVDKVFE